MTSIKKEKTTFLWIPVLIQLIGIFADSIYHSIHGHTEHSIPWPHWVTLIGLILGGITAYVLLRKAKVNEKIFLISAIFGIVVALIGGIWDNTLHLQGIEPPPLGFPHLLVKLGLLIYLLGIIISAVLIKRRK